MDDQKNPKPAVLPPPVHTVRRLGHNVGGYRGEGVDIAAVLDECLAAATAHGWRIERLPAARKPSLLALTRAAARDGQTPWRVYLSAGIHGDEPAGPLAVLQLLQEDRWPLETELWLCPCLNPTGFARNQRENDEGIDLNRQYLQPKAEETRAHIQWLRRQPSFDLCLCLHEDWESHGFYVYELNPDNQPSLAELMVAEVEKVCPIDRSEMIEGRPAQGGVIRPSVDPRSRPQWPEAFFLLTQKTRLSYTLEAPSDFPLAVRTAALVASVNTALAGRQRGGRGRPDASP